MKRVIAIVVGVGLGACGGGDDESAFQGVYSISEWTENDSACVEGTSILPQPETALYVKHENFLGTRFLNAYLCSDLAECVELSGDDDTIHLGEYYFDQGSDDGWNGGAFFGTTDPDGNCVGDTHEYALRNAGEGIEIETQIWPTDPFPEDADGFCTYENAVVSAVTCRATESIIATFVQELP